LSENFIADKRLGFSRVGEVEDPFVQENLIGFLVASFFPRSLSEEAGSIDRSIDGFDLLIFFLENRALDLEERKRGGGGRSTAVENSRMGFVERLGIDDPRCRVLCKRKKSNVN
jgi:hypothetical protein